MTQLPIFGLKNESAVCYLNSLMQCLFSIEILNEKAISFKQNIPTNCFNSYQYLLITLKKYGDENPNQQDIPIINPRGFLNVFVNNSKYFQMCRPEDADEFLTIFLDSLHEEIKQKDKSIINDLFNILLINTLYCEKCNYKQIKKEYQNNLYINPPEGNESTIVLENCIKEIVKSEIIEDYKCEKCNQISCTTRDTGIKQLPICLNLVFSRFTFPYTKLDCLEIMSFKKNGQKLIYKLNGAVFHIGSRYGGHYYAICRRGNYWYRCDDTNIYRYKQFDPQLFYGAYIIFYSLVSSSELSSST